MAQNIYPLSASNNQHIPLDVIESKGYVAQAFLAAAPLATRVTGYDSTEVLLLLRSSADVIVTFATTPAGSVDSTKSFFAFANKDYVLSLPLDYLDLTGNGTAGTAVLNYITKYDTLALGLQLEGEG